jgi:hypothetical protein
MLNHAKVMAAMLQMGDQLFPDFRHEYAIARHTWTQITNDPLFILKASAVNAPWPVPSWNGALDAVVPIEPFKGAYQALSVDGSQIYPDRHQGASCFLINTGLVSITYGKHPRVKFDTQPFLFSAKDPDSLGEASPDYVNAKRQELEMLGGLKLVRANAAQEDVPKILLFDGSLIFWHLESKSQGLLEQFLPRYIAVLHELYEHKVPTAGYISMPRSRELVNLIRLQLCDFDVSNQEPLKLVDGVVDAAVVGFYLEPFQRTQVFKNNAQVSAAYPPHLAPYFFYLHVGDEIGRVEIPAWIAQDQARTDFVAQTVLDQSIKGRGYPVVLAEAHEQAVVKGPDREFFYQLLNKIGIDRQHVKSNSIKSMRKRSMAI